MITLVKFEVGDYSGDGHEQCQEEYYNINKTIPEIQEAYNKTKAKLNIGFEYEFTPDYINMFADYEDRKISEECCKRLKEAGIDVYDLFVEDPVLEGCWEKSNACDLYLEMAKLNLPDLEYEHINDETPTLWRLGYGLFN